VVIKKLSELLDGHHFFNLKTVSGWAVLFKVLCKNRHIDLTDKTLMPKNFSDLVYKVKLLFNGASRFRFALGEGQKRTYASVYYLLGLKPTENLQFHGYSAHHGQDHRLPSASWTGSGLIQPSQVKEHIEKKLNKLSTGIYVKLLHVQADTPGFVPHVVAALKQLSERSANANARTQERGWRAVMISLCQNLNSKEIIVPYELRNPELVMLKKDDTEVDWMENYRKKVAKQFWDSRTVADVTATFATVTGWSAFKSYDEFELAFLAGGAKNSALNIHTLNLRGRIASPKLFYVLLALVTCSATNPEEMEALSKLILSSGKLTTGKIFIPSVLDNTIQADFPDVNVKVSIFVVF
jgi:hypothetical protein